MTARGDAVAPRAGDAALMQSRFEDHEGLTRGGADDFAQAGDDLTLWAGLGGFEEEGAAAGFFDAGSARGGGEEVVDAVVVDFVHGDYDGVVGGGVGGDGDICD